ncbi:MAG TPA: hypothetical protein VIO43_05000 [Lutibacter sp.]
MEKQEIVNKFMSSKMPLTSKMDNGSIKIQLLNFIEWLEAEKLILPDVSRFIRLNTKPILTRLTKQASKLIVPCDLCIFADQDDRHDICQKCSNENDPDQYYR